MPRAGVDAAPGSRSRSSAAGTPAGEEFEAQVVRRLIRLARQRIDHAVTLAEEALRLANGGNTRKAVRVSLDIEPLLHEATRLVDTASLLGSESEV